MKSNYRDYNEDSWQVMLWEEGRKVFFSNRTASIILKDETELWGRGSFSMLEKAAKLRRDRQCGIN